MPIIPDDETVHHMVDVDVDVDVGHGSLG